MRRRSLCADCGQDTTPRPIGRGNWEHYMVRDEVWAQAGMPRESGRHYLCIGCIEERLGRCLQSADFIDAPINEVDHEIQSARLVDRLTRR